MISSRVRIVSDGTPGGTSVFVNDDILLENVTVVSWECDARSGHATATLRLIDVEVDAYGECPVIRGSSKASRLRRALTREGRG